MNPTHRHILKYPSARTTTIAYLEKREAMTERLKRETARKRKPLWRRVADALARGWGAV